MRGQAPEPESFELRPPVPVPDFATSREVQITQVQQRSSPSMSFLPQCGRVKSGRSCSLELREDVGQDCLLRTPDRLADGILRRS